MSTPNETREIPIDDTLRSFMGEVSALLDRYEGGEDDAIPAGEDALQGPGVSGGWIAEDRLRFLYDHEGHRWAFTLTPLLVRMMAAGDLKSLPMEHQGELVEEEEEEEEVEVPEDLMAAIASLVGGAEEPEPEPEPAGPGPLDQARNFVELLVKNEKLELVEGAEIDDLCRGLMPFLSEEGRAYSRAEALIDWLIERDEVEEVFLLEDELAKLLKHW